MNIYGKYIIIAGLLITIIGVIVYFFGDKFSWFGKLPGDINIEREDFRFYFPLTTMILLTVILNIALRIIRKFL